MAQHISFVVLGASGDLARKMTFPALYRLFARGEFPPHGRTKIVGFARSAFSRDDFHGRIKNSVGGEADEAMMDELLQACDYVVAEGGYEAGEGYKRLNACLDEAEKKAQVEKRDEGKGRGKMMRIYYVALPPDQFSVVAKMIRTHAYPSTTTHTSFLLLEKPYASSLATARSLTRSLLDLGYSDQDLRLVDHYLGKDLLRQILALRFSSASTPLAGMFHRDVVQYITVDFKETFGAEGRGGYFDNFGIVRDVVENHLMHLLAFATMERPAAMTNEALIDARLHLLRCVRPVRAEDVLIGQYVANPSDPKKKGYRDDKTVKDDSKAPTYACCRLFIDNPRWRDVPIILRAGKALDEDRVELALHFKPQADPLLEPDASSDAPSHARLVLQEKPSLKLSLHTVAKRTGSASVRDLVPATLEVGLRSLWGAKEGKAEKEHEGSAYEFLFRAAIEGDRMWFVGQKEAEEQWSVWEMYLAEVEGKRTPMEYVYGSKGPKKVDAVVERWLSEGVCEREE